jgi:hypothetical protein
MQLCGSRYGTLKEDIRKKKEADEGNAISQSGRRTWGEESLT